MALPRPRFGRGRSASLAALRGLSARSRKVAIKARIVRHGARAAPLASHLAYLRRDGVTRDGAPGRLFDGGTEAADASDFAERCQGDRHHFRFIVAPEDAAGLADLRAFTRDLMDQMAHDLGTALDWVAIDHWNTEHPHVHVLVRGKGEDGRDLVISPDYISRGMRARAEQLVTLELGPRSDREVARVLAHQVEADRWTALDRRLAREASRNEGLVDLRPGVHPAQDTERTALVARARKLERLGLAAPGGRGQWMLSDQAEPVLRALGERGDIIKRIHRGLTERGIERAAAEFSLNADPAAQPIIGRLVSRGLDDELKGTAYVVIDGIDGRAHHVRLADHPLLRGQALDAASDAAPGAIVEVRRIEARSGGPARLVVAVRSDLAIEAQVAAPGATWLDRQLVAKDALPLSAGGFGGEVSDALASRTEHLIGEGLARRQGSRVLFARGLLDSLRRQELDAAAARIAGETGLPHHPAAEGDQVSGQFRRRLALASGRFAMIDDGLGFTLVPWTPSLEKRLGRQVAGRVTPGGSVDWEFGRKRGLGV